MSDIGVWICGVVALAGLCGTLLYGCERMQSRFQAESTLCIQSGGSWVNQNCIMPREQP